MLCSIRSTTALCLILLPGIIGAEDLGIAAPKGFEVSLFAGDDLAHDIFSMTIDRHGRVVVAGKDYVKILHDDDQDGKADRATLFSNLPKSGAHGMVFVEGGLLCTGDNALMMLRDRDDDGMADGQPEIWAALRHPEHGANGIVHGPDGWFYVICGNDAGVTEKHATTTASPVKKPQSGAVVRFSPDGRQSEIFAHGFRNPYDLDFSESGQLFTVDADGERDHHLPWYAPTRLFDIQQGMHHGWVLQGWQRSWNRPPYFFDNVSRAAEIGRGSPTGLVCYRHTQFPARFRGSILSACWTMGRVYHLPLTQVGSTFVSTPEIFLETTGETGFAPVDLAVGPQGDLFIAIGGRRTRGSVFRVSYRGSDAGQRSKDEPQDDLGRVLNAPQPLASWSRAQWMPLARQLGREKFVAALGQRTKTGEVLRAMEILTELFGGIAPEELSHLGAILDSRDRQQLAHRGMLAARAAWSLGRTQSDLDAAARLAEFTASDDPLAQRAAWEAIATLPGLSDLSNVHWQRVLEAASWGPTLESGWSKATVAAREQDLLTNRRVRSAALLADARRGVGVAGKSESHLWRLAFRGQLAADHAEAAVRAFEEATDDVGRLSAVRLIEIALGDIDARQREADVYAGYSLTGNQEALDRIRDLAGERLAASFPAADRQLNVELARLLAMLGVEDSALMERLTGMWSETTSPPEDIHYLICLSRLPGERSYEATQRTASALCSLHAKMAARQMHVSRHWPARVGEALAELYRRDPKLPDAVVAHRAFRDPVQALLARSMPGPQKAAAIRKLLEATARAVQEDQEVRWSEELIALAAELPAQEAFPLVRLAWDDYAMRDAVIGVLAAQPRPEDRERFVEALSSVQPQTVERAAEALASLPAEAAESELTAAFAALRQACTAPEAGPTRQALARLLVHWTGQAIQVNDDAKDPAAAYEPWFDWLSQSHPAAARRVAGLAGATAEQWQARLAQVDWESGDAKRGLAVFEKKACHRCHAGESPLGPNLAGTAARFSRNDLFTTIIDPHKEVSPLYQTTQVVTKRGKVYSGLVVYESPDSTLLQTAPDVTTRIAGDEIVSMKKSKLSLMPSGLLNDVTDQDLADLYAYLKTLRGK
jgi:putative membrane-bound dehydrogenase-like protein